MGLRIAVVIPAYNEEQVLPACLEALQRQTRPADTIVVVDNNSTDDTAKLARHYGAHVITERGQGIMPAACTGYDTAAASSCDIIARIDADTVVPPDWLARIVDEFEEHPETAAITGPGRFYGTGRIAAHLAQGWYMWAYFILVGSALAHWPLFGSNMALRRQTWQQVRESLGAHRIRTDIHDDIDLSLHLPASAVVRLLPDLRVGISARSLRAGGLTSRYRKGFITLSLHWPTQAPWRRWIQKLR